ncbi:DNA gyrase inhibitor YacG [Aestuariibius sp. 2305UL40-4]|uniref:DNA gyrase inhibitor YacG n=1 Tax=Aestuariibius violaceus TaxID=3234132 RepID=UPI00345E0908
MTCPICDKPAAHAYRPFCSKRCADKDLGRWMTGAYAVPSAEPPDEDEIEQALTEQQREH